MNSWIFVALSAVVFYVAIPGIGAFVVRARWRRFRAGMIRSARWPQIHYGLIHGADSNTHQERDVALGLFRMVGKLEATEGDELIWISTRGTSIAADLSGVSIYVLPPGGLISHTLPDQTPRVFSWPELAALPEGTKVYVAGALFLDRRRPVLRNTADIPLLVVVYDSDEDELLPRAIWTGRQRNEYWNDLTPIALTAGFLAELILSILFADVSPMASMVAMIMAVSPILPIFPPGVVAYYGYRRLWKHARKLRAYRDMAQLPLRYAATAGRRVQAERMSLPDGGYYVAQDVPAGISYREEGASDSILEVPAPDGRSQGGRRLYRAEYEEGESTLADPLAGPVLLPEDPTVLAGVYQRRARRWELLALSLFVLGILVNQYLVAILLSRLV